MTDEYDDDIPSYAEFVALVTKISEHAERLPPTIAIEVQRILARLPGDLENDAPHTPKE